MQTFLLRLHSFLLRDDGQDLVEYALVVACIAFGSVTAMSTLSGGINVVFGAVTSDLNSALT
jgi:pilus assembly protein Flp/PilA